MPQECAPTIRRAFLLIGALALALATVASAQDGVNRIRSFDAVLTIHADGSLNVTEELTVRLTGESNEIIRYLSLRDDSARDGEKKLGLTVLAVTDENGQPVRAEEVNRGSTGRADISLEVGNAISDRRGRVALRA